MATVISGAVAAVGAVAAAVTPSPMTPAARAAWGAGQRPGPSLTKYIFAAAGTKLNKKQSALAINMLRIPG